MLKSKIFPLTVSVFRSCTVLGIILMMVSGCANMQQNDATEFSAMETNSDTAENQSDGIDMEAYGIDY